MNGKIKLTALTFDDGPNTETTLQVLEKLEQYGVTATFFLVGDNITDESAAVSRRAFDMGCELCNHSKTHSAMPDLSADEINAEISYTDNAIKQICGSYPSFFRAPYIAVNDVMFDNIRLPFICGVGAEDWEESVSADERARRILEQVTDGTVILLHDMKGNFKTVEALDTIIPELKKRGYEFVTVGQLFERSGVAPKHGIIYSNVYQAN